MLGMQVPTAYAESFEPLVDAWVDIIENNTLVSTSHERVEKFQTRPWWLVAAPRLPSKTLLNAVKLYAPKVVILPSSADNLIELQRAIDLVADLRRIDPAMSVFMEWDGSRRYLPLIESAFDCLAMPSNVHRGFLLSQSTDYSSVDFHYSEFCSLDELRRATPSSMHTCAPILSALRSIDFRMRERRPKLMPTSLDVNLTLSSEALDLALSNTKAIREAASWA